MLYKALAASVETGEGSTAGFKGGSQSEMRAANAGDSFIPTHPTKDANIRQQILRTSSLLYFFTYSCAYHTPAVPLSPRAYICVPATVCAPERCCAKTTLSLKVLIRSTKHNLHFPQQHQQPTLCRRFSALKFMRSLYNFSMRFSHPTTTSGLRQRSIWPTTGRSRNQRSC